MWDIKFAEELRRLKDACLSSEPCGI